ncbi:MAG: 4'-phosphopantetheinyl transferase superfamily protein [Lentisphaerae bacterium]|nr:4'-phosphopantetheinyl transferase superfamily protein [Lentisphaerota bacterium]
MSQESTELFVLSAASDDALVAELSRFAAFLDRVSGVSLLDVAYTASLTKGPSKIGIVASDVKDLFARILSAKSRIAAGAVKVKDKSGTYFTKERLLGVNGGKLAFLFPGVMSFYPDMLRDVAVAFPECREAFDELEESLGGNPDFMPSNFIFPPAPYYRHDADIFSSGAYAQALVSVYAASSALSRLLAAMSLAPDGVVGFAGGDLSAMIKSGAAGASPSRIDRVRMIRDIYGIVDKAVDHLGLAKTSMISVLLRKEGEADAVIGTLPPDKVSLCIEFSPRRMVFAVDPQCEDATLKAFADAGIRTMKLAIDRPFNTPRSAAMVPAIRKFATAWMKSDALLDVYSCALAGRVAPKVRACREDVAERWARPALFAGTVRSMYDDGYRVFLEVGPRGILTNSVEDTLAGRSFAAIALDSIHRRGMLQLHHSLAQLASIGAELDIAPLLRRRRAKCIDLDSSISLEVRNEVELKLSRRFPRMTLIGEERRLTGADYLAEPRGRGAKAERKRQAELDKEAALLRQFERGAVQPLISDAEEISSSPGISCELVKTFSLHEAPFIADYAVGASQISFSDQNLRGALFLPIALGVEIMAETAMRIMPKRVIAAVQDVNSHQRVQFKDGSLRLSIRAERVATSENAAAFKVSIRSDRPDTPYIAPIMECTVMLTETAPEPVPFSPSQLYRPRPVHWDGREIYPSRLCYGRRLWGIVDAETWAEDGVVYEVEVPRRSNCVRASSFPLWAVDPLLLQIVASGFKLWRSHEKFPGAFSMPFGLRRLNIRGAVPKEGAKLKCYMHLTGVTPHSQFCDITVTGGDGNAIMELFGWEEDTARIPKAYCDLLLQPASTFLSEQLSPAAVGSPATNFSTAFICDVPYPLFESGEALWLKIMSKIVLSDRERRRIAEIKGSVARQTEWLFGRIVAKEAVRRFLRDFYQARWCDADVEIYPNREGKPVPIGEWREFLSSKFDIAIAHTSQFVVAVAAANARVGVDVESVARNLSKEFAEGVFNADEIELAAQSASPSQTFIRFWCAKEAVSKALGCGIRYPPKELFISDYHSDTGRIIAKLTGAWGDAFKNLKGRDIEVASKVMRDHALAFCFIPSTFFSDESD